MLFTQLVWSNMMNMSHAAGYIMYTTAREPKWARCHRLRKTDMFPSFLYVSKTVHIQISLIQRLTRLQMVLVLSLNKLSLRWTWSVSIERLQVQIRGSSFKLMDFLISWMSVGSVGIQGNPLITTLWFAKHLCRIVLYIFLFVYSVFRLTTMCYNDTTVSGYIMVYDMSYYILGTRLDVLLN